MDPGLISIWSSGLKDRLKETRARGKWKKIIRDLRSDPWE